MNLAVAVANKLTVLLIIDLVYGCRIFIVIINLLIRIGRVVSGITWPGDCVAFSLGRYKFSVALV
jgi:hypothetical protein